jgi:mannose-6-phosphate isomerase-like protein (cupin superfamily)
VDHSEDPGMQMHSVRRAAAEHYTWGDRCDGWHLVKDERLSVIEEQMPPGTSEVLHYHGQSQQFLFVLSGEAMMSVKGEGDQVDCARRSSRSAGCSSSD